MPKVSAIGNALTFGNATCPAHIGIYNVQASLHKEIPKLKSIDKAFSSADRRVQRFR